MTELRIRKLDDWVIPDKHEVEVMKDYLAGEGEHLWVAAVMCRVAVAN
jgi:hypothetical protein